MDQEKTKLSVLQHIVPPTVTAILGLVTGVLLAQFNSHVSTSHFFLEKQAKTADDIAVEFSRYVENWDRLVKLRKEFDSMKEAPSTEEKEYFDEALSARSDARDKLFSAFDSTHLYYSKATSELVLQFESWDNQQAVLTIEKLPSIGEWRNWQIRILRQLQKDLVK